MYLNVVLGTLEMQWMLVSFIRKVSSPYDNWSQARMIDELLSTTSYHCYLGNKYLIHAYPYSIQPLVGCILAWNSLFAKFVVLVKILLNKTLYCIFEKFEKTHTIGNIQIMFMIHLSRICPLVIYCISIPQRALMCNIDDFAKWIPIYDTCCLSQNIPTSSSSLIVSCDVSRFSWLKFIHIP